MGGTQRSVYQLGERQTLGMGYQLVCSVADVCLSIRIQKLATS